MFNNKKYKALMVLSPILMGCALMYRPSIASEYIVDNNPQPIKDTVVVWSTKRVLRWSDFQGKADQLSDYKAMTYVQIGLSSKETSTSIVVDVPCLFIKNLAWSKEQTAVLLEHEQLHFDIAEVIARNIRMQYSVYKSYDLGKTYEDLKQIYRENYHHKLDSINRLYDLETVHGTLSDKQKEWESKIAKELKKLDTYAKTKVTIKRVKK